MKKADLQKSKEEGCEYYSKYIDKKLLQLFSPHPTDQLVSPCYHIILTVAQTYHSKVTPIGSLTAEKIAEAVLLYM